MSMVRSASLLAVALSLSLTSCHDARRETTRDYLQSHPPDGFEVALIPEKLAFTKQADGTSESVVSMRYRLTRPTVEIHDALSLPRGAEVAKRIAAVRGWALSSLPAGDAMRTAITSDSAGALAPFPTKRIVTQKGTEVEALVVVTLQKKNGKWQVHRQSPNVNVPGSPDRDARIPFEDAPAVAAKFGALETAALRLEESRRKYLADRQRAAEHSLAELRALLQTGKTFEGRLPDQTPVRVIISQGAELANPIIAVVTVHHPDLSSARYTGGIVQEPSGRAIWRAAQVTSLSGPGGERITDTRFHPILTLAAAMNGLAAELRTTSGPSISFRLGEAAVIDLIPDVSSQESSAQ